MDKQKIVEEMKKDLENAKINNSWEILSQGSVERKLAWFEKNKHILDELHGDDLYKAYDLLLLRYLRIQPSEVPIVYKDDKKIIWHSYNWCPTIQACADCGLDTRDICKRVWVESVQKLIEKINSNLKFDRTYDTLRPHGKYCEEMITLGTKS
jgi:tRNA(adenine34) deaminase